MTSGTLRTASDWAGWSRRPTGMRVNCWPMDGAFWFLLVTRRRIGNESRNCLTDDDRRLAMRKRAMPSAER